MIEVSTAAARTSTSRILHGIRPVFANQEGRGKKDLVGSCVLFVAGDDRLVVTAGHVLANDKHYSFGLSPKASVRWPLERRWISQRNAEAKQPDLVFSWFRLTGGEHDAQFTGIELAQCRSTLNVDLGPSLAIAGYPVSKSKSRPALDLVRAPLQIASVQLIDRDEYPRLGFDFSMQLAVRYLRRRDGLEGGGERVLAAPHGMSGGALIAHSLAAGADPETELQPFVVGFLTDYFKDDDVLVATRADVLLGVVAPWLQARAG